VANEYLRYFIEALWQGDGGTVSAAHGLQGVSDAAESNELSLQSLGDQWQELATPINQTLEIFEKVGQVVGDAFETMLDTAQQQRTINIFGALTKDIGGTTEVMKDLREATRNTVSDVELMAGAGDLMRMGLVGGREELTRMTAVVGALGIDMQALALTISNKTTARFDTMGISVTAFKRKLEELKETGMDVDEAFSEAFLQTAEQSIEDYELAADDALTALQQAQTKLDNFQDSLQRGFYGEIAATVAEGIDGIGYSAEESAAKVELLGSKLAQWIPFIGILRHFQFLAKEPAGPAPDVQALAFSLAAQAAAEEALAAYELARNKRLSAAAGWSLPTELLDTTLLQTLGAVRLESTVGHLERMSDAAREAAVDVQTLAEALAEATAIRVERGSLFAGLFDFETLGQTFGESFQFVIDKTEQIKELSEDISKLTDKEKLTDNQTEKLAELRVELEGLESVQGKLATGWDIDEVMTDAAGAMLQAASSAGAYGFELRELAGATEAFDTAYTQSIFNQMGAELGEQVAAGAMTAQEALEALGMFVANFNLEDWLLEEEGAAATRARTAAQQHQINMELLAQGFGNVVSDAVGDLDAEITTTGEKMTTLEGEYEVEYKTNMDALIEEMKTYIALQKTAGLLGGGSGSAPGGGGSGGGGGGSGGGGGGGIPDDPPAGAQGALSAPMIDQSQTIFVVPDFQTAQMMAALMDQANQARRNAYMGL